MLMILLQGKEVFSQQDNQSLYKPSDKIITILPNGSTIGSMKSPKTDLYQEIDYDAVVIKFRNGTKEIVPVNDIRSIVFDYFTAVLDYDRNTNNKLKISNYPNPFSTSTTLEFELASHGEAVISVYDLTGHLLRTIDVLHCTAGLNSLLWDGLDNHGNPLNNGIYICKLSFYGKIAVQKLTIIK